MDDHKKFSGWKKLLGVKFKDSFAEKETIKMEELVVEDLLGKSVFTDLFPPKTSPKDHFSRFHSAELEIFTGFEPEDFLKDAHGYSFEDAQDKLEFFGTQIAEQSVRIVRLANDIESQVMVGVGGDKIIKQLDVDPRFLYLSKEQKFKLKLGALEFEKNKKEVEGFFEEH